MILSGFYKIKSEYIELIKNIHGTYKDSKERPIYCCIQDKLGSIINITLRYIGQF